MHLVDYLYEGGQSHINIHFQYDRKWTLTCLMSCCFKQEGCFYREEEYRTSEKVKCIEVSAEYNKTNRN